MEKKYKRSRSIFKPPKDSRKTNNHNHKTCKPKADTIPKMIEHFPRLRLTPHDSPGHQKAASRNEELMADEARTD